MADLIITPANVGAGVDTISKKIQFGETVAQGECVYLKSSDNRYWLADNSDATVASAKGIALTGGAAGEYGLIATSGEIDLGATLAVATVYTVSSTSGKIHPDSDLASGEILSILGYAKTAAIFVVDIANTEVAHP